MSDLLYIFRWYALIFAVGIIFLPLSFRLFSSFQDKGYLFSKILGIGILSYLIFALGSIHLLSFSFWGSILVLLLVTFFLWVRVSLNKNHLTVEAGKKIFNTLREKRRLIVFEELLFFLCLLFWSYIRSHNPDIHDLEKFMDFGFINSILRSEYFPPTDMWFSPLPINYYYFGHLMTAVLTKISQVPSSISFNLMIATLFAFTLSGVFSIAVTLVKKIIPHLSDLRLILYGITSSLIIAVGGNLHTIYTFFKPYDVENPLPFWKLPLSVESFPNSYWYPNATRFIHNTIHEFPLYSFVVSDLHGHVLSIPLVLLTVAFLINLFLEKKISVKALVPLSFFLSLLYMTNAWDSLIYLGLSSFFIFYLLKREMGKLSIKLFLKASGYVGLVLIFLVFFSYFFNQNFSPFASQVGIVCSPQFLREIGSLGPFVFEENACQKSPIWQLLILFGFFLFFVVSYLIFLRKAKVKNLDVFIFILVIFSIFLIITPEFIYLKDIYTGHFRANTMFKLFYQAFILLGISTGYIIARLFSEVSFRKSFLGIIFLLFSVGFSSFVFIYPYLAVNSAYDFSSYKSLDGTSYLKKIYPEDYEAIIWINKNIKGQPVILEAQGDSYTDYARISSNTGLPTVLGWTVHEWLWRGSYSIPEPRILDIKNLYESPDLLETRGLLKKYNISYVFLGNLEKEKYNTAYGKFEELGSKVFSSGGTIIYEIY